MSEPLYYIRSDRHFGMRTTMTIDDRPYNLYTDDTGYLRQIKDSLGDPTFSQRFADTYLKFPPALGWTVTEITDNTPEVEYDILHIMEDGYTAQVLTNSPITAKLREATTQGKRQEAIIQQMRAENDTLKAQIIELKKKLDKSPPATPIVQNRPPAPAIENGKIKPARKKPGPLAADDNSVATINIQEKDGKAVKAALDDIPDADDEDDE